MGHTGSVLIELGLFEFEGHWVFLHSLEQVPQPQFIVPRALHSFLPNNYTKSCFRYGVNWSHLYGREGDLRKVRRCGVAWLASWGVAWAWTRRGKNVNTKAYQHHSLHLQLIRTSVWEDRAIPRSHARQFLGQPADLLVLDVWGFETHWYEKRR